MAAETRRIFSGFQRRFLEIFFALATPHGFGSKAKETKKNSFYHNPWFKVRILILNIEVKECSRLN